MVNLVVLARTSSLLALLLTRSMTARMALPRAEVSATIASESFVKGVRPGNGSHAIPWPPSSFGCRFAMHTYSRNVVSPTVMMRMGLSGSAAVSEPSGCLVKNWAIRSATST